ncbi:MAG: hypothetical protein HC795_18725, partial [Coleofasciculaceae cyanobacterium RL_1_1]|nr:hypothetical protein [Coleofasciculaceae cyanobacterium RL_1_1]
PLSRALAGLELVHPVDAVELNPTDGEDFLCARPRSPRYCRQTVQRTGSP